MTLAVAPRDPRREADHARAASATRAATSSRPGTAKPGRDAGLPDADFCQDNQLALDRRGHRPRPPLPASAARASQARQRARGPHLRRRRRPAQQSSPTFGRHVTVELDAESGAQLFVPRGFAHGFCTLAPDTLVFYKVDAHYAPESDAGIFWADEALGIAWPVATRKRELSPKDAKLPRLKDIAISVLTCSRSRMNFRVDLTRFLGARPPSKPPRPEPPPTRARCAAKAKRLRRSIANFLTRPASSIASTTSRTYPDVAKSGLDPLHHFVRVGIHAGRSFTSQETIARLWREVLRERRYASASPRQAARADPAALSRRRLRLEHRQFLHDAKSPRC